MTYTEAKAKLKELANGRYCSLEVDCTFYVHGEEQVTTKMYISEVGWCQPCRTYELAFISMAELARVAESPAEVNAEMETGIPELDKVAVNEPEEVVV